MIIKQKVAEAMNAQIQSEFTASAQYVAIAVYFDEATLPDLAAFFYRQAEEERMHAMKFVHFMLEAGAKPIIPSLPELRNNFSSASDAVQFALDQEIKVTNQWANRLIGDENYKRHDNFEKTGYIPAKDSQMPKWYTDNEPMPDGPRSTFSTHKFYSKGDALEPSGLKGPVMIRHERVFEIEN